MKQTNEELLSQANEAIDQLNKLMQRIQRSEITVSIEQDGMRASPREDVNIGVMWSCYKLHSGLRGFHGDYRARMPVREGVSADGHVKTYLTSHVMVYDHLYLRDVDGVQQLSHTPFKGLGDTGLVGMHYITYEQARRYLDGSMERAYKRMAHELWTYNQWAKGNCWIVSVKDADGKLLDVKDGFIGDTLENAGLGRYLAKYDQDLVKSAWEQRSFEKDLTAEAYGIKSHHSA